MKQYLKKRNQAVTGKKEMLAARAFACHEMNIPLAPTSIEKELQLEKEYRRSLCTEDEGQLPDPLYDFVNWAGEKDGMKCWPPTLIQDISIYLNKHEIVVEKVSLTKRLLCDYKEQKAYSYFSSKFVFEIEYHPISDKSEYCFLKSKCSPSQRLSDIPHDVWVSVKKQTGEINSAYCTCFAGLGQTCNHVAAVLLKVDFCWQHGDVQRSCTSVPCRWTNTTKAVQVVPMKISGLHLKKPGAERPLQRHSLNSASKALFQPHQSDKGITEGDFLKILQEISPESVTLGERSQERNRIYVQMDSHRRDNILPSVPVSVVDIAAKFQSSEEFVERIPVLTPGEVCNLEKSTRGQSDSTIWLAQRKGRITALKMHEVHTKMEHWKKDSSINMNNLMCSVMGYKSPPEGLKALKYG